MVYSDYEITTKEEKVGEWKAYVRRLDGKTITTEPYGAANISVLSTMTFLSEDAAIKEAKTMIDAGGMK